MESNKYALGQFETPLDVADLLMCMAIRRPADRVLDPGCGDGFLLERAAAWMHWLAASPREPISGTLLGVERDPDTAIAAQQRVPEARILNRNFLGLNQEDLASFDAIISNPPYTRAEWIGHLEDENVHQLAMFSWEEDPIEPEKIPLISHNLSTTLSGRSGLHAYYLVHCSEFLEEGGRLAFILPNGWLDVAYGVELKQFLLDHYRIIAVIESAVERWFEEAWINTCILVLEKCSNLPRRQGNLVRLARLKKPLHQLLPNTTASPQRFLALEHLVDRLFQGQSTVTDEAAVHVKEQRTLHPESKWGMALRSPMVFRHYRDHLNLAPLKMWAQVQRGYTTGANEFFYLSPPVIEEWGIEKKFRQPLLKSLRGVDHLLLSAENAQYEVLLVPPDIDLKDTAAGRYIRWGEEQGFHLRRTCAGRDPWYSFPIQNLAPIVLPKGIWHRHFAPLLTDKVAVDQQLYQIMLFEYLPLKAIAALMNSVWFALQLELRGRVSFGKGLLWLAAYELEEVQLPDPRLLSPEQVLRLEEAFDLLAENLLVDSLEELNNPARQALDEAVFDILGFTAQERIDTLNSLIERLNSRWQNVS
ncbi:MAG: class I SAM-dependent DNA methyltransferase [Candidatus Promineifilaceae bacterium]